MDIRPNLESGVSEEGTGKEAYGKPVRAQGGDKTVPRITEGGKEIQGE